MKNIKTQPLDLHEEYYQASPRILESFPRFRPPLDIFFFKEQVAQLLLLSKANERISADQREEILKNSNQGLIFLSRKDHPTYAKHISKQLDLILMDTNLKPSEIALIFQHALTEQVEAFMDQPVAPVFENLQSDSLVLTEYLWQDPFRIKEFRKCLWPEHTLAKHSVNTTFIGLALYLRLYERELRRKHLDEVALGLLVHDLGMSKIPAFIRQKTTPLTREELEKIREHCWVGAKSLHSLNIRSDTVLKQILEHQERLDGKGYPQKISGKQISIVAQICAVADSFCAMITHRPYAEAQSREEALKALSQSPGLNAKIVRTLQAIILG
ncbi:HD domain-containing protein [Desulfonatronum thiosulfatophilum]|uniref:HD domain-containing protein n=1 Tax=Desulfonatronum thiosulfatophilum TaxID=617002 RepID=A0A1G6ANH1_9BACT|nr:HD domain-containing phosphohydrolase [Desulfonatronum thiosulfatophilum]SDB09986.1 HD domain-containing protein [Desulfonatronum thiosulfatophilum]